MTGAFHHSLTSRPTHQLVKEVFTAHRALSVIDLLLVAQHYDSIAVSNNSNNNGTSWCVSVTGLLDPLRPACAGVDLHALAELACALVVRIDCLHQAYDACGAFAGEPSGITVFLKPETRCSLR